MDALPQVIESTVNSQVDTFIPVLVDILTIPSQSRAFDPEYLTNGLLHQTALAFVDWIKAQNVKGLVVDHIQDEGFSPFIYVEVPGEADDGTVLFYGHIDKQPPFPGWREGLHAYKPVIEDGKLYARGGADDSYSVFASVLAVKILQEQGIKHPRVVMIFEADEESGSQHIDHYLAKLKERIGLVDIVFCLDSGCGNFDTLWITTTLRGMVSTNVTVEVLNEGVHSGDASGIVPSSFRILRQLLDRIENPKTGEVIEDFQVNIPGERYLQATKTSAILGNTVITKFPWAQNTQPVSQDPLRAYLNRIWKAQLAIIGADGLPNAAIAGNVLRPYTTLKISLRLPPTKNPKEAIETLTHILTTDVPYNATVKLSPFVQGQGYNAPPNEAYLDNILNRASKNYFGQEFATFGEGGSIPLMNTLNQWYPKAQFIVTGVLGPQTNAHGPNEFLHIPFMKKLICCITQTLGEVTPHLKRQ
ncbi:hypothetical protein pb186bvf_017168 [Paramecium bursaria]